MNTPVPTSVEDAVTLLSGAESSEALSGGTDLISRMKDYVTSPDRVVYLKDVKALAGIKGDSKTSGLTIGAGTILADILSNEGLKLAYPALWQATYEVGTPQIRNMATVGGNLLQRPRCWYFRAGNGLLAKKDGKSLVRDGDNRYHAIFMTEGDALFVNPSSLAVPLFALGAKATISGSKGERTIPVEELYRVPKIEGERELTIAPGELLTKITIPAPKGVNASYEARQKQAHDWPIVLASVNLEQDGEPRVEGTRHPLRCRPDPLAERGGREGDHRQARVDGDRHGRGRSCGRGIETALDERVQGRSYKNGRQACPARRHRRSILGERLTLLCPAPSRINPLRI